MTDQAYETDRTYEVSPIFQRALSETREKALLEERNESTMRRVLHRSVNVLLLIAVVGVFLVGYGLIDNRWYRIVAIQGGSMDPTLHSGDAILLTRPPQELEVGMIVTLEVDGSVVTHRVISVEPDGTFSTMGDANSVPDDWGGVDVEVIGVHRVRIPLLGKLLTTLASVRGSNAWLLDRSSVSGSTVGTACFGPCETVSYETVSDETGSEETASNMDRVAPTPANDLQDPDGSPGDTIEPPDAGSDASE